MNIKKLLTISLLLIPIQLCFANILSHIENQKINLNLHAQLPENIKKNKWLVVVDAGSTPPHIIHTENTQLQGASVDFINAIGEILGVDIKHEEVAGFSAMLMGLKSERYDMIISPLADTLDREKDFDFIDYIKEFTAVLVPAGNPYNIKTFDDLCGKKVASQSGDLAERRLKEQSESCIKANKAAIEVSTFKDQCTALLALKSGRVDVMRTSGAVAGYFVLHSANTLEQVNIGLAENSPYLPNFQGLVIKKDSLLTKIMLAAMQELKDNGTYAAIMHKWGLENNKVQKVGLNMVEF